MCSPRLSSSLHPCYRNNHKCGLWAGGYIGPTGCGEVPSEAHDISVPWPMELKLRDLRPRVTPCVQEEGRIQILGLALVNRSCRSCFPGRCQQHEISCAGWPARPGVQCDGVGEGLGHRSAAIPQSLHSMAYRLKGANTAEVVIRVWDNDSVGCFGEDRSSLWPSRLPPTASKQPLLCDQVDMQWAITCLVC
jgi:hypothetical protein